MKVITSSEARKRINNHELWLRGDNVKNKGDFSNLDFSEYSPYTSTYYSETFSNRNLQEANFQKSNLKELNFRNSNVKGTDFRDAIFDFSQFNEKQKKEAIFTDKDLEKYKLKKEIEKEKLEEENKDLKEENKENEEILENITDEKTHNLIKGFNDITKTFLNEERSWLIISFISFLISLLVSIVLVIDLFLPQYTSALLISIFGLIFFIVFFVLFVFAYIDIQNEKNHNIKINNEEVNNSKKVHEGVSKSTQRNNIKKKNIFFLIINKQKIKKFCIIIGKGIGIMAIFFVSIGIIINIQNFYSSIIGDKNVSLFNSVDSAGRLLPVSVALISFLYFCLYQYGKAKNLRIENQNKIAILYGFEALKADSTPNMDKGRFYDRISEVVFTKIFQNKKRDVGLPVDQVTKLAADIASVIVKNK